MWAQCAPNFVKGAAPSPANTRCLKNPEIGARLQAIPCPVPTDEINAPGLLSRSNRSAVSTNSYDYRLAIEEEGRRFRGEENDKVYKSEVINSKLKNDI